MEKRYWRSGNEKRPGNGFLKEVGKLCPDCDDPCARKR